MLAITYSFSGITRVQTGIYVPKWQPWPHLTYGFIGMLHSQSRRTLVLTAGLRGHTDKTPISPLYKKYQNGIYKPSTSFGGNPPPDQIQPTALMYVIIYDGVHLLVSQLPLFLGLDRLGRGRAGLSVRIRVFADLSGRGRLRPCLIIWWWRRRFPFFILSRLTFTSNLAVRAGHAPRRCFKKIESSLSPDATRTH